ncbi:MAG: hypothetical protein PF636_10430 [Actinomycetota bacterium]|nr:hypothetical protein [Actinomycetota bacterium]
MLRFEQIVIGDGGLPSCGRCAAHSDPIFRPAIEVIPEIHDAALLHCGPVFNVSFLGTEAFLHPELPLLVTSAIEADAKRVGIMTSGQALSHGDNAAGILHAGVRHVDIVCLGDEALHDGLTHAPGSYAAAREGVKALHAAAEKAGVHIAVMGHIPVCRHNVQAIPDAVAGLVSMGVVAVHLDPQEDLDVARNIEWFGAAFQTGIMHGTWVCAEPADIELFGRWSLHVGDPCHVGVGPR